MVLLARSLHRSLRPVSASARALSTSSSAFTSRASTTCRAGLTSRPALAPKSSTSLSLSSRSPFGAPASIRSLTGQREKVKVLLVLYDGGKHAEEVRDIFFFWNRENKREHQPSLAGLDAILPYPNIIRRLSVGVQARGALTTVPRANQELRLVAGLLVDDEGQVWLGFLVFYAAARPPAYDMT